MDLSIVSQICITSVQAFLQKQNATYVQAATDAGVDLTNLTWGNFFSKNLLPVTLGNIVGGAICVGCAYWFIYLRKAKKAA